MEVLRLLQVVASTMASSMLMDAPKRACSGVFIGENVPRSRDIPVLPH